MRTGLALVLLLALSAFPAAAQDRVDQTPLVDVLTAVNGVWAYDLREIDAPGDFTCGRRPMAMRTVDGGARLAAMRPGEDVRYALVLDVRNDFPLGPALSVVWQDAPLDAAGEPQASVLVMDGADAFSWIEGPAMSAFQSGARELNRSPRRARCPLAPLDAEVGENDAAE